MTFRAICVALLLSSLLVAGCGTVANLFWLRPEEGGMSPFGGVRHDECCIKKASNGQCGSRTHPESESEQFRQATQRFLCAADLPLTLIGDVVTWPYTASYSFINQPIPTPPVTQAQPILGPPVTPGRTNLIAQVIAAQGLVSPGTVSPVVPQTAVALRVASFDALALPVTQAPAEVRDETSPLETLPQPKKLPDNYVPQGPSQGSK
jgi:hypothetical protein